MEIVCGLSVFVWTDAVMVKSLCDLEGRRAKGSATQFLVVTTDAFAPRVPFIRLPALQA